MTSSNSSPKTIIALILNLLKYCFLFLGSCGTSVILLSGLGALTVIKKRAIDVFPFAELCRVHAYDKCSFQNTLAVVFLIRPVVHSLDVIK